MNNTPCDTKKLYDTEFEATVGAAKTSSALGRKMQPYKCGKHWHIGNVNRKFRSRNRNFDRTYCDDCEAYIKSGRWQNHTKKIGHIVRAQKRKEA